MSATDTERRFKNLERKVGELTRRPFAVPPTTISVKRFGAVADAHRVRDAAMTSGSAVLTSASALFERSDVGLVVGVQGAGAAGVPLITTIASYQSATQVTLAVAASTTVSGKVCVWGTVNTAAFQAAIDAGALLPGSAWYSDRTTGAGGGVGFVPDGSYLCGPLVHPNRSGLIGQSERVMLYMLPGMTAALFTNDLHAQYCTLGNFTIIGNRELQSSTAAGGIKLAGDETEPYDYTLQEDADANHRLFNIHMDYIKGNGVELRGRGETLLGNIKVQRADGTGFIFTDDSYGVNLVAAVCINGGFHMPRGGGHFSNLKAWWCGGLDPNVAAPNGWGFFVQSWGTELVACQAQDNMRQGFLFQDCQRIAAVGINADSNSRETGSQYPGVDLNSARNMTISGVSVDRGVNANKQYAALRMRSAGSYGASRNNSITLVSEGNVATDNPHIMTGSDAILGNDIKINAQDGSQTVTSYIPLIDPAVDGAQTLLSSATPITPNPSLGREISITLANNITLNAPTSAAYGDVLTLKITQDATGGRTITWDAIYVDEAQPTATASTETVFRLIYDGTNWRVSYNTSAAPVWRPVDPYAGGTITLSLQNNVELAAPTPSHTGMRLTFIFSQDGATSTTVTWNAAYQTSWQPTQALGSRSTISFVYDGAKWLPIMAETGAAPAAHAATHTAGGSDPITVADSQLSSNVPLKNTANTFSQNQTINKAAGDVYHVLVGVAGTARATVVYTGASLRWIYGVGSGAETGANAGSDFAIVRYNDAGASLGNALLIARSTGAATFGNTVKATAFLVGANQVVGPRGAAVAAGVNSVAAPTKAEFDALVAVVNDLRARLMAHGLIS